MTMPKEFYKKPIIAGIATDVECRFAEHISGKGSKYVRARGARRIIYTEPCASHSEALQRELCIKRLPRARKLAMVHKNRPL